jgi:predicted metal-dependent phosphoesterase TrpH
MSAFDIHVHTRKYSGCSFINHEDIVKQAVESQLDGIAITEHGMRWPDKEFAELRRLADQRGIVLINGQEIYTENSDKETEGEFLVFGLRKSLTGSYSASQLADAVHAEEGILIAAHPYKLSRGGRSRYYGAGDLIYKLAIDAIELCHPDHGDLAMKKVRSAMEKLGIPGTGGSDAHKIFNIGACVTLFENKIRDESDFIREIRSGNIRAENRMQRV